MNRPGITAETLAKNQVVTVTPEVAHSKCGVRGSGLWIPYHDLDGKDTGFGRLRLDTPKGSMKYTQATGSGSHLYLPVGITDWEKGKDLYLIEGEFKALALAERGYQAIGLPGFYGWKTDSELAEALAWLQPKQIFWCGDADTLLNPDYYQATVQLAQEVPGLQLVRMDWNGPKGADDLAEACNGEFSMVWDGLPRVTVPEQPTHLVCDLLDVHQAQLDMDVPGTFEKLCKTLARFEGKVGFTPLFNKAKGLFKLKVGDLRAGMKEARSDNTHEDSLNAGVELLVRRSYTTGAKWYLDFQGDGNYTPLGIESWKNQLMVRGADGDQISMAQAQVEQQRFVDYAGPLCGRSQGVFTENGVKLLVTSSPEFVTGEDPREAETQNIEDALKDTFIGSYFWQILGRNETAWRTLMGWIKQARVAIADPKGYHPGQCLVLMGKTGIGKTLAQGILTKCMGGRESDPENWLLGRTPFNKDLWAAEHMVLSDASIKDDWSARQQLQGHVKKVVANSRFPLHAKFCDAYNLMPVWRLSISVNMNPSSILAVPVLDEDTEDKLIYLLCEKFMDFTDGKAFRKDVDNGLSAFCWLVDAWDVPKSMVDLRFGIKAWHHPTVKALVHGESVEGMLEGCLDQYFDACSEAKEISGPTGSVLDKLKDWSEVKWIRTPNRLARLLVRLGQVESGRYEIERERESGYSGGGKRIWHIRPK
jgi:hypothetical protein